MVFKLTCRASVWNPGLNDLAAQGFESFQGAHVMPGAFVKFARHPVQRHRCMQQRHHRKVASGCGSEEPRMVHADTAEGMARLGVCTDVTALQCEITAGVVRGVGHQNQVGMVAFYDP